MATTTVRRQGIFWLATIPHAYWTPFHHPDCSWLRGQLESGTTTGYLHWQILVSFTKKKSLAQIKQSFGEEGHWELSRSSQADAYVWKEDTRIEGTQFEFGIKPFERNSKLEWDTFWANAILGDIMEIPAEIRIRHYTTFRRIREDYAKPIGMVRTCDVFVGPTGTGKSMEAWKRAGPDAYPKDPNSKFWCGYSGQSNIVIDEFRGRIDISHLLRWLDRYPINVELKGSSIPCYAENIWITSNLPVEAWYPEIDEETLKALKRRLKITHFNNFFNKE